MTDEPLQDEAIDEVPEIRQASIDDSITKKVAETVSNQYNIVIDINDQSPQKQKNSSPDLVIIENDKKTLIERYKDKKPTSSFTVGSADDLIKDGSKLTEETKLANPIGHGKKDPGAKYD